LPDSDLSHSLVGISPLLRPNGHAVFTSNSVDIFDSPSSLAPFLSAKHGKRTFYFGPASTHYRCHTVFVPLTSRIRVSDTLDHYPDPLFPFQGPPNGIPPPDPTSPQVEGIELVGERFRDPDLGVCTVLGPGQAVFLQPDTGNLLPGPTIPHGWTTTLLYRSTSGSSECSSVAEVARWVALFVPDPCAFLPPPTSRTAGVPSCHLLPSLLSHQEQRVFPSAAAPAYRPFGPVRFGPVQFGPVRFEPVRFGSVRTGLDRFGSDRFGSDRFGSDRVGSDRVGSDRRAGG
jgi:hypothetical protein